MAVATAGGDGVGVGIGGGVAVANEVVDGRQFHREALKFCCSFIEHNQLLFFQVKGCKCFARRRRVFLFSVFRTYFGNGWQLVPLHKKQEHKN